MTSTGPISVHFEKISAGQWIADGWDPRPTPPVGVPVSRPLAASAPVGRLADRPAHRYHFRMREQNRNEPYRGELGPLYDVRLGDLRAWHEPRAQCPRCQRDGRLSLDAVSRKAKSDERLLGIAR